MLQTLFLLLATAVGWRPSLLADTSLAVGTVSLRFGTVCCLLVPDGCQMGNRGQWFLCVPVPKITAYRVSLVSWLLTGTSKQHYEKPQHLFLTPNDLKKNVADIFSFSQELLCICRKNITLQMLAAIKPTPRQWQLQKPPPQLWKLALNVKYNQYILSVVAPQSMSSEIFQGIFQTVLSAVKWKNKTKNIKCLWKAAGIPKGQM